MLIPISHEEQTVSRLPWITIAVVAVNIAVFLLTLSAVQRHQRDAHQQVQVILRYAAQHPYLQMPEELAHLVPAVQPPRGISTEDMAERQAHLDRLWADFQDRLARSVYRSYGYIPAAPSLLALLTSLFMHGGWLHLLGNMLFLWLAGGPLEDRWGRAFFSGLYLVSGVIATLAHGAMYPASAVPLVGASGAIAGLMGAFLVRLTTTRIRFFYWIFIFRGTFYAPAFVMLPLWLLQQFLMARSGPGSGIAVWAHIGGFVFGVVVAAVVRLAAVEERVLAPSVAKKTTWEASAQLTAALAKLDGGDVDGAIHALQALLQLQPDNIEARTALIDAFGRTGDRAAAGKASARLVSAYFNARDMAGARTAVRAHRQAFPEVPLAIRDLLRLAGDCQRQQNYVEAASLLDEAVRTAPGDPLAPRALLAHGQLLLRQLQEPKEALSLLERALAHPRITPELQQATQPLLAAARAALQAQALPPGNVAHGPPAAAVSPAGSERGAEGPMPPRHAVGLAEPPPAPRGEMPRLPDVAPAESEPAAESRTGRTDSVSALESEPVPELTAPGAPAEIVLDPVGAAGPCLRLAPAAASVVAIDKGGVTLADHAGGTAHLPWQEITAVSVASVGQPPDAPEPADFLVLDLVLGPATAGGGPVRCVRLTPSGLRLPQLQDEPSPVRGFQRLVATILKVTGATPVPSREGCLGSPAFPAFDTLAAYEAELAARLAACGSRSG
jgi:membrane associated rhomboid family serine protease